MAETGGLSAQERETWLAFYTMRRRLDRALDAQLQRDHGVSISELEVLMALIRSPGRRLRVRDLVELTGWEKSRVSHLVSRMEKRDLIERTECDSDGRGTWIGLTSFGRRTVVGAIRGHSAAVRRYFLDTLEPGDAAALEALSARVVEAIGCAADEDVPAAAEIA